MHYIVLGIQTTQTQAKQSGAELLFLFYYFFSQRRHCPCFLQRFLSLCREHKRERNPQTEAKRNRGETQWLFGRQTIFFTGTLFSFTDTQSFLPTSNPFFTDTQSFLRYSILFHGKALPLQPQTVLLFCRD